MRFLVDNALSPLVSVGLCHAGHDAVHIRDYGMQTASDVDVLAQAVNEGRILISAANRWRRGSINLRYDSESGDIW